LEKRSPESTISFLPVPSPLVVIDLGRGGDDGGAEAYLGLSSREGSWACDGVNLEPSAVFSETERGVDMRGTLVKACASVKEQFAGGVGLGMGEWWGSVAGSQNTPVVGARVCGRVLR
jgi:hypothetical protein